MKKLIIYIILQQFSCNILHAQEDSVLITAKIENKMLENILDLKASATNISANYQELTYLLVSIKKGSTGNLSNNKQSGKFTLNPKETKPLSSSSINLQKNDALKVYLYIKDEQTEKLLAKDSLEISPQNFDQKIKKISGENYFELKGLTIDQTKTKIGKDFYDNFYMEYSKLPQKLNNPVTISELPTRGTATQISLEIDDKNLYSFVSNPNEEYLNEQLKLIMKILLDFERKKTLMNNEFRY